MSLRSRHLGSVGLSLTLAAVAALSGCGSDSSSSAGSAKFVIKYGGELPAANPGGIAQKTFANLVQKMSNGQIAVKNYYNGQLGTTKAVNDQVRGGQIQMTHTGPAFLAAFDPEVGVFGLPFLWSSDDAAIAAARGPVGTQIATDFEKKSGMKILAWDEFGLAQLISRNPIKSLADLKGLKVRAQAGEFSQKPFSLVGAIPVPVDTTEIFTALSNHTIDADDLAIASLFSNKDWQVVKYLTYVSNFWYGGVVVMNAAYYNKLPANLQQVVLKAAQQASEQEVTDTKQIEQKDLATMKAAGVKVSTLPAGEIAAWKAKLAPLYADAAKKYGADVVAKLRG